MRSGVPSGKRTRVGFTPSDGRPTPAEVTDNPFFAKPCIFPLSLIDTVSDNAYIGDIGYGDKAMLTKTKLEVLRAAAATGDASNARGIESRRVRTRTISSLQADGLLYGFHGVERSVPITPAGLVALAEAERGGE